MSGYSMTRSIAALLVFVSGLFAGRIIVAETGGDYTTIQAALNAAGPGDSILVREKATPYYEKLNFSHGGNAQQGYLTLMAYPGEKPIIDGTGVPNNPASYTDDLIYLENVDYVRIIGFEIRNVNTPEGSGIRVYGYGSYIEIRDNEIHEIRGGSQDGGAMGITIYGSNDNKSINHLIIDGNHIHDCDPAWSEALTLNGNVEQFEVTNNVVEDVNNIGIDFIGGESWLSSKFARNGRCAWNRVYRANSPYDGGYAAGIYVDGGQNIVIENNFVSQCDLGIEIGAENAGVVTDSITVRNNVIYLNQKAGLVFGGYDVSTGRVKNCQFTGNTLYQNDVLQMGYGELWIQYAENNRLRNNIFYSNTQNVLLYSESGNVNNDLDFNLWFTEAGEAQAQFVWNGSRYVGFTAYRSSTGQDASSLFADPQFKDPANGDFHITPNSPCVDSGDSLFTPDSQEQDLDGQARLLGGRVDIGADELNITSASVLARSKVPEAYRLFAPFPNPFNPTVYIHLQMLKGSWVTVSIYNIRGQKVRVLQNRFLSPGDYRFLWNGRDNQGAVLPGGVYEVLFEIGGSRAIKQLVLVR